MKAGDKVTITHQSLQGLYRISNTDAFEIDSIGSNNIVKLKPHGWFIATKHLKLVQDKPMFSLADEVDRELSDYIEDDKAFTVFDVTTELRKKFPGERIAHYLVKDIVHDTMTQITSYERSLIEVGTSVQPWLYYPEGYDPSSYQADKGPQVLEEDEALLPTANALDNPNLSVKMADYTDTNFDAVKPEPVPVKQPGKIRRFFSTFGI